MTRYPLARPVLGEPEWQAVRDVITSGWVSQGPKVSEFELGVAARCAAEHAVAVSSCTAALHLALVCAQIRSGDEVIVPSMSFIATANAVVMAGGIPVFAEIEPETFNLDFNDVRRRITSRTRAIVLVHQLGIPADINTFQRLAREHGLTLVEDAACAIGSTYGGEPIGSHSEYVCFSFHPRKLITTGDGGMILTPSAEHAALLRRLRQHGMSVSDLDRHESARAQQEHYLEVGFNYRLTDIQAAVGIEQLRRLSDGIARRGELRAAYDRAFADCPGIAIPFVPSGSEWNVQTYAVRLRDKDAAGRDAVRDELLRDGIATRVGVMTAHREPAYSRDGTTEALPLSEKASDSSLALPLYGEMSETDCRFIAERAIRAVEGV